MDMRSNVPGEQIKGHNGFKSWQINATIKGSSFEKKNPVLLTATAMHLSVNVKAAKTQRHRQDKQSRHLCKEQKEERWKETL